MFETCFLQVHSTPNGQTEMMKRCKVTVQGAIYINIHICFQI